MINNKQVLVILTPGFPENEADSTCLPAQQNFIKAVNKNYPSIKIIILSFQYPFAKREYTWNGNTVYAFGGRNKGGLSRRLLWNRVLHQLEKIQQENTIGGMLSFWCDECAYIAARFAQQHRIAHYCWLLGQDARPGNRYVSKIETSNTNYIALSDFVFHLFKKNYGMQPCTIIPPGICYEDFERNPVAKDIDLLFAGSLIPLKQADVFLQVAARLKMLFPQIKIVVSGDGPEASRLKSLAQQLGLAGNIQFTGALPYLQLLRMMQRSKLLLHPSAYEGFGMVCAEALYAGAQVISFCQPMQAPVKNWHIAAGAEELYAIARGLLEELPAVEKIKFFSSAEAASSVMDLFQWQSAEQL